MAMFDYPTHSHQQKHENESLAIFMYHMRKHGLIRDLRENDYGIDLEFEFVNNQAVIGKTIKIQLKALGKKTKNGQTPSVGKLKQSTLNYWAELSYRVNVFVVLVEVETEKIWFTTPIFWEATKNIDTTNRTKSIKLEQTEGIPDVAVAILSSMPLAPTVNEILILVRFYFSNFKRYIEMYDYTFHHDLLSDFDGVTEFEEILSLARVILWRTGIIGLESRGDISPYQWQFYQKANETLYPNNLQMQKYVHIVMKQVTMQLIWIRKQIVEAYTYWIVKDRGFYQFTFEHDLSSIFTPDGVNLFSYSHENIYPRKDFDKLVETPIQTHTAQELPHAR